MNTNRIVGSVPRRPSWAGRMMSPLAGAAATPPTWNGGTAAPLIAPTPFNRSPGQGYSDSFSGMLQNMFGGGGSPMGIMGRIPMPAGGAGLPPAPMQPPVHRYPGFRMPWPARIQEEPMYQRPGGAPLVEAPLEYGPYGQGVGYGGGVGPLLIFKAPPNIWNGAVPNPKDVLQNRLYPGQGPLTKIPAPSFAGSIPQDIRSASQQAEQEAELGEITRRMREAGQGFGPNAQAGLAADRQTYADAYGSRLQSIMNTTGISEQERARFAETGSYGFGPSPVQSAASGGAIGAGMAARPFERINNSPVMMNPDRGLGSILRTEGRYGLNPLQINRQRTDDQSMNKMDREREAATPPGQVMPPPGTANYTRTTADGRRAGTSRRQFALDGLAAAQAAGDKGRVDAFMTEIAKMDAEKARIDANDVQRRQKYRDEHGGLNRRGVENQERENRKALRWMMKNNIKPNSPLLKLKFPGAAERMGMASPLAGAGGASGSPVTAPSGTPRAAQEAAEHMKTGFAATPIAKAMGLGPDATHIDLVSAIDTGPDQNFEDTDLVDIQKALQAQIEMAKQNQTYDEKDPFGLGGMTGYAEEDAAFLNQHYMGLLSAKTPQERAKWLEAHKNRGSVLEENNKKRGAKGLSPLVPSPPFGFDTAI